MRKSRYDYPVNNELKLSLLLYISEKGFTPEDNPVEIYNSWLIVFGRPCGIDYLIDVDEIEQILLYIHDMLYLKREDREAALSIDKKLLKF